jgi:hypothetical protein
LTDLNHSLNFRYSLNANERKKYEKLPNKKTAKRQFFFAEIARFFVCLTNLMAIQAKIKINRLMIRNACKCKI